MAAPPFPTPDEWTRRRPMIERLRTKYTLAKVMEVMKGEGFVARYRSVINFVVTVWLTSGP